MSLIDDLLNGRMKLHELERHLPADEAVRVRREFIERVSGASLRHIANYSIDMERASARNIENPVGVIQIPLGVAGPLKINGEHADGSYYVPLATSEGALVASVNRGCSVITASGGATVRVTGDCMTRAPVIKTGSVAEALELRKWMQDNIEALREEAESTTRHGKLLKIDPIIVVGSYVYPRFVYSTGDSMGMNMVTIATEKALELLTEKTGAHVIALSGNACVDKKPSALNLVEGRGKSLVAEVTVPGETVERVLKATPESIAEVNTAKNLVGSAAAGNMGFNAHYANIIGAVFLATGQDEAHIVEGSLGVTLAEERDGDLYFSVSLPDVPLATVGGGTGLETASECLDIMGVRGSGKVHEFAEIVGGAVLAGELSLMGALAAGHLARAHRDLGRG
ncbi:hydroxymethylglutaryl-CoA reductase (NADPH) [Methanothermobacter wolfeii]|uniref:3-hydroxy-3-methylglutaryl coenzyme A reductase n=1 Tax=Methanothermobacter wolfeii TaxID=145261 RepID=A0A9E7RT46_METWO|nr:MULTISPECIES: hydroxymethylglutaryl-CoA reductase (NADPH) [Methanothermobacter]NLM02189.1 hydroxymethylglutaryl-CoA reductase (NADPH) [Methanothermobacter wolfeii]QHN06388.1 hydroxymethylglutaryl-CoA reductase (NADPH) [Methanothermobacter sp. THM-1]UXH30868.1 hydroxymethylglutaryl-CoA reductase (NADPH) [Methanothermobacter wolfeii]SCM57175.1 3-hydroxy-3-methylglutaryl-coenzyme A reductase [Methanothermobacter wolfeii]